MYRVRVYTYIYCFYDLKQWAGPIWVRDSDSSLLFSFPLLYRYLGLYLFYVNSNIFPKVFLDRCPSLDGWDRLSPSVVGRHGPSAFLIQPFWDGVFRRMAGTVFSDSLSVVIGHPLLRS